MKPLSGMTGFAREAGQSEWGNWAWEAKSVNGRALDVRVTLPQGFEALERSVKNLAQKRFERGSVQINLRIEVGSGTSVHINEALLSALIASVDRLTEDVISPNAVATLMTIKGVVETGTANTRDIGSDAAVITELESAAARLIDTLHASRLSEGTALTAVLMRQLAEMDTLRLQAGELAKLQPALLKEKLDKQLTELGARDRIDADRLAAELALNVARADVREELDRLAVHVQSLRDILAAGSPAGRKLDFLAQELNREANTLCSKSASLELTQAGLGLKGVIDQFKEQAANVE